MSGLHSADSLGMSQQKETARSRSGKATRANVNQLIEDNIMIEQNHPSQGESSQPDSIAATKPVKKRLIYHMSDEGLARWRTKYPELVNLGVPGPELQKCREFVSEPAWGLKRAGTALGLDITDLLVTQDPITGYSNYVLFIEDPRTGYVEFKDQLPTDQIDFAQRFISGLYVEPNKVPDWSETRGWLISAARAVTATEVQRAIVEQDFYQIRNRRHRLADSITFHRAYEVLSQEIERLSQGVA